MRVTQVAYNTCCYHPLIHITRKTILHRGDLTQGLIKLKLVSSENQREYQPSVVAVTITANVGLSMSPKRC